MNAKSDVSFDALNDIRDHTYLLSLGNEFLCEDLFLGKIGTFIDSRLDEVKENIVSLKKQFPGKFVSEVNTDDIFETLRDICRRLQEPDEEIHERCKAGELGRELEAAVKSLTMAIKTIRNQVEGASPSFSKTDSALNLFRGIGSAGSLIHLAGKWLVPLVVAAVLVFSFLFITMERETAFLEEIARGEEIVQSQQMKLSELVHEKETLSDKIEVIRRNDMSRQNKIAVLELSVKLQDLEKKIGDIQAGIRSNETRIRDNLRKVEEMKSKSFIRRLLRQ